MPKNNANTMMAKILAGIFILVAGGAIVAWGTTTQNNRERIAKAEERINIEVKSVREDIKDMKLLLMKLYDKTVNP